MQSQTTNLNFGILYIATGQKYVDEAVQSAKYARQIMPETSIAIFLDDQSHIRDHIFDRVNQIDNPQFSFIDKVTFLQESPFENTLFLDTDTLVIEPIYELGNLLNQFDLACAHAPVRTTYNIPVCSSEFPELNTGVILYKRSDIVIELFQSWLKIYQEQLQSDRHPRHDQAAFREALFKSPANCYILPPEYNLRTMMPSLYRWKY